MTPSLLTSQTRDSRFFSLPLMPRPNVYLWSRAAAGSCQAVMSQLCVFVDFRHFWKTNKRTTDFCLLRMVTTTWIGEQTSERWKFVYLRASLLTTNIYSLACATRTSSGPWHHNPLVIVYLRPLLNRWANTRTKEVCLLRMIAAPISLLRCLQTLGPI